MKNQISEPTPNPQGGLPFKAQTSLTHEVPRPAPAVEPDCSIYRQGDAWLLEIRNPGTGGKISYRTVETLDAAVRFADHQQMSYRVYAKPRWICTWPQARRYQR